MGKGVCKSEEVFEPATGKLLPMLPSTTLAYLLLVSGTCW